MTRLDDRLTKNPANFDASAAAVFYGGPKPHKEQVDLW